MLSIIIPVYFEDKNIVRTLAEIEKKVKTPYEILVVYDIESDPTVNTVYKILKVKKFIRLIKNCVGNGRGVVNAIKSGIEKARGEAIVVVMADLSDDLEKIDQMYRNIKKGDDIVCGSRYMKGGRQIGGPLIKGWLSRLAGLTAYHLFKIPTHDPTNAFKMYRKNIFDKIKIESDGGFEYSLEIIAKAHRLGYTISELPATWRDRTEGRSKFKLIKWLPKYLRWYLSLIYK